MKFVTTPSTVRAADDILELARLFVDDAGASFEAAPDVDVSCRAGCSACCSQPVPVSDAEVRSIKAYIDERSADHRAAIADRIAVAADALSHAGFTAESATGFDARAERHDFALRYFAAGVPCPLLEDGVCGVRPVRPLACREYFVTSDPLHCATPSEEKVVRIQSSRDIITGFNKVAKQLGDTGRGYLAFALAEPTQPAPEAEPKSGVSMMRVMTSVRLG